jgi:mono/diheme cytochrome c family protein
MKTARMALALAIAAAAGAYADDAELVKRGEYLARAGDCVACHTAPGGRPMAGGLEIPTPIGAIVSTNVTPSRAAGIGGYTFEQFARALRQGIRADGARLYPAMPYTSYALVTDEDARALYAYFMQGVAPVDVRPKPTQLPFPFDVRLSMAVWNLLFLREGTFQLDTGHDAQWNRGAYLVRGLGHCGTCHTPRNLLMAEKPSRELAGGAVGNWRAPNITSDSIGGIGGWSSGELVTYLRAGHAKEKSQAAGPMAEAVDNSLRFLSEGDLLAMASFLKTTTPVRHRNASRAAYEWGEPADAFAEVRGVAWPADPEQANGAQLYDAHCGTCHGARGEGSFDGGLPALFHNAALGRLRPDNLILVILDGIHRALDPPELRMPGFDRELSDRHVATLCSYILKLYGNGASVSADRVRELRLARGDTKLVLAVQTGLGALAVVFVIVIALVLRRVLTHGGRTSAGEKT